MGEILRDAGQYKEAHAHLAAAIAEYRQLESLDGEAVSLAALAKLERFRLGSRQALPLALAAVDKLSEMAGRFCQGVDRRQFSQLHSWCYSLAFLCAAESGNAQAALKVAAVVQADKYGKRVRELLLDSDNAELRKIGRQIVSTEVSLNGSAEEPLGRSATTAAALRWTLDRLFEQLRGADAEVADSFPREVSMPPLPPPLAGHDRLTIFGYEEVVPPRLDRGVIVVWEDSTTSSISKTALSPDE